MHRINQEIHIISTLITKLRISKVAIEKIEIVEHIAAADNDKVKGWKNSETHWLITLRFRTW